MKRSFVNLKNAASRPDRIYRNVIKKIREDGVCPFCPENFARYHKKPVIKTGRYWVLTENMYPYRGAKHHLLLVHKKHIERTLDISPGAWKELQDLVNSAVTKRIIKGGALVMRFGEPSYTGASVTHLHANIIGAEPHNKKRAPILFRVG